MTVPSEVTALANLSVRVHPLVAKGKVPLLKDWPSLASSDPQKANNWGEAYPDCNWGAVTGKETGAFVVDVDPKSGGNESWSALIAEHGDVETWECATGGGGRHFWFRYPLDGEVRNSASAVAKGIDVRGEGGQVAIPPSVHPSGNLYAWVPGHEPWSIPLAQPPVWLARLVISTGAVDPDSALPDFGEDPVKGSRNDAVYHQALLLARRGADRELVRAAIKHWLNGRGQGDVTDAEILATVDSAYAKYEAELDVGGGMIGPHERTDADNAQRFVEAYTDKVMFVHGIGWHSWTGVCWEPDLGDSVVTTHAVLLMRHLRDEALLAAERKHSKAAAKVQLAWSMASQNSARLRAMIDLASKDPAVRYLADDLDPPSSHHLLNFTNGTLDLRAGELRNHHRKDMLTKALPYAYDPDALAPTWLRTLDLAFDGDQEMISYMQRALGYSLSGYTDEQCVFICWGEQGNNGKSTIIEAVQRALGPGYARTSDVRVITSREVDNRVASSLAGLVGTRFVAMSEAEEHQKLSEALLKQLTGGDTLEARLLYRDPFTFIPQFKVWLRTNERPQVRGSDDAIWRRIRLIPFTREIPKDERKRRSVVDAALAAEAPGILAWMVQGFREWREHGLDDPSEVTQAVDEYRGEMDVVGLFLDEMTEADPTAWVPRQDLYRAYTAWARDEGMRWPFSARAFGKRAGRHLGSQDRQKVDGQYVWRGISLNRQGMMKLLES